MLRLSIIIPTYNSGATIQRCLSSIINRTFTDFEVIIKDGESVDDTIDLINAFQQAHGKIRIDLRQERDEGAYDAMRLYFLGSDDELHDPTALSKVMGSMASPSGDVVYGNVYVVGDAGVARDGAIYDRPFNLKKLLAIKYLSSSNVLPGGVG